MKNISRISTENGAVMVEFALIATILIILLAGIIQFGLIFNTQLGLENAVREGARFASLPANANNDQATANYMKSVIPHIPITTGDIQITPITRRIGQPLTVTIQYQYQIPVTLGVFPETISLRASSTMMQN